MKTSIVLLCSGLAFGLAPLGAAAASGATASANLNAHRVVLEFTSGEMDAWNTTLNNVENLRIALGESTPVVVIVHGKGLDFLKRTNTGHEARMKKLADAGVVFAACENTMKRQQVTKESLLPFATTVDSAIAEVVRKQAAGWSYIRNV